MPKSVMFSTTTIRSVCVCVYVMNYKVTVPLHRAVSMTDRLPADTTEFMRQMYHNEHRNIRQYISSELYLHQEYLISK